jgi:hypothetical protein
VSSREEKLIQDIRSGVPYGDLQGSTTECWTAALAVGAYECLRRDPLEVFIFWLDDRQRAVVADARGWKGQVDPGVLARLATLHRDPPGGTDP